MKPSEHMWRTLLRVEHIAKNDKVVYFIIPGWNASRPVKVSMNNIPDDIMSAINNGTIRLYAYVNIGTERAKDLKFDNWELSLDDPFNDG